MKNPFISHYGIIAELSSSTSLKMLVEEDTYVMKSIQEEKGLVRAIYSIAPNCHRKEEFDLAESFYKSNKGKFFDFSNLQGLCDRLLEFNGSEIIFCHNEEDEAQTLSLQIHPYILAAWQSMTDFFDSKVEMDDIKLFAENISPYLYRNDNPHREYADNHIHLNGCHNASTSVLERCNETFYHNDSSQGTIPEISRLSYEEREFKREDVFGLMRASFQAINEYVLTPENSSDIFPIFQNKINLIENKIYKPSLVTPWNVLQKTIMKAKNSNPENVLLCYAVDFYLKKDYTASLYCYYTLLFYLDKQENIPSQLSKILRVFIVSSNILRNHIVMSSQKGLNHFTKYFTSSFRKLGNKMTHGYNNLSLLKMNYAEVKVSPDSVTDKNEFKKNIATHFQVLQRYNRGHRLFNNALIESGSLKKEQAAQLSREMLLHYVIHFIKTDDDTVRKIGIKDVRHAALRGEVIDQAKEIDEFLADPTNQNISLFEILLNSEHDKIELLKKKKFYSSIKINLTQLLIGLDAAGNECDTPPEVFAPAIRFLRRMPKGIRSKSFSVQQHHKRFHLSMHVGEDFNHIITGMRRIDETIRFCDYKQYDRLGHALALGINPKKWFHSKKEVLVTKEEYFDNLVWLWRACEDLSQVYYPAAAFKLRYERLILQMGNELYGNASNYKVNDYYDAWFLRRNCPLNFNSQATGKLEEFTPDLALYKKNSIAVQIFKEYHHDYQQLSDKRDEVIAIRYGDENLHDYNHRYFYITNEELDLYEALQDFLITRYEQKGIIIEACPSSNITIGGFDFKDHPIFRWHPPKQELLKNGEDFNRFGIRKSIISSCINTDDPAIFPTTIHNEFKMIKYAAKEHYDCTEHEAETWIELLRKNGVDIFMRNWRLT